MEHIERIAGADRLVAVFGYWPSFHDAEVQWLRFDRRAYIDGCSGPTFDALIHVFEMTSEVSADGYYVLRHHNLVHLRLHDVAEFRVDGFNHQNELWGLSFEDVRDRQLDRVKWEVRFDSSFGVDALFQCFAIEIVSVVPCSKTGERIHSEPNAAVDGEVIL